MAITRTRNRRDQRERADKPMAQFDVEAIKEMAAADPIQTYGRLGLKDIQHDGNTGLKATCPFHPDSEPSLKILTRDRGDLRAGTWHCFGCGKGGSVIDFFLESNGQEFGPEALAEIGKLLGLEPKRQSKKQKLGRCLGQAVHYQIVDAEGHEVATHCRQDYERGKSIWWEQHGTRGLKDIGVTDLPLYRLPELLASDPASLVVVTEGEKDCDALVAQGILAVATVCGAAVVPSPEVLRPFLGHRIRLWPDNDTEGQSHMYRVAVRLVELGAKPLMIEWPEAPHKGGADDFKAPLDELRALINSATEPDADPLKDAQAHLAEQSRRPRIMVGNRQLHQLTDDGFAALEKADIELFIRTRLPVQIVQDDDNQPVIETLTESQLRGLLDRAAQYIRITSQGRDNLVEPPLSAVRDMLSCGVWPWPSIKGITQAPVLRPDGSVLERPGYDAATQLFYKPATDFTMPRVSSSPDAEELAEAQSLLWDVVAEFPFVDDASKAGMFALMLTPTLRPAIEGCVPMALIDAPQAGTGKTLLAEVVGQLSTGYGAAMIAAPDDDEEYRKRVTAALLAGKNIITFDNVERAVDAPSLGMAITANVIEDRLLGVHQLVRLPVRATWVCTGNNISLKGDLPRRCYWVRLDAEHYRPWQRPTEFKHPDLLGWVAENRGRLIWALLTLARAWFAAGKPTPTLPRFGGFEQWTETIGGILEHVYNILEPLVSETRPDLLQGTLGLLTNLDELYQRADPDTNEWELFLAAWLQHIGEEPVTAAHVAEVANDCEEFREALPSNVVGKDGSLNTRKLGRALSKKADVRFGPRQLFVSKTDTMRRAIRWTVSGKPAESQVDDVDPSTDS